MRILAIGDFHGKYPKKLDHLLKKYSPDLIISIGDYKPNSLRKLFFKHVYAQDKMELWDVVGKRKFKESVRKDFRAAERVVKRLDRLRIPVYSVFGNNDWSKWPDAADRLVEKRWRNKWHWMRQDFWKPILKDINNVKFFDYSSFRFGDYIFIGGGQSSFPGHVQSKNYRNLRKKMNNLFNKYKEENRERRVIFVSHNVPYNTKLDLITAKDAHKRAKGKHYGSKIVRRVIEGHKPVLHIAGHIHEGYGKDKLGKTVLINVGSITDGNAAVIDLPESLKRKLKVRMVR